MFKWKVVIYKTDPRTWKVYQVEKEFTDPKEYEQFLAQHPELNFSRFDFNMWPTLSLGEWFNLEKWIEDIIWKRFGITPIEYQLQSDNVEEDLPVDLSKYEKEVKKIEQEKKKKEQKINSLKQALKKLEDFKKKFEEVGDKQKIKQINEDIKKVKQELKKLES